MAAAFLASTDFREAIRLASRRLGVVNLRAERDNRGIDPSHPPRPGMLGKEALPMSAKNVLGQELTSCSTDPMTGFYRDGCCNTGPTDFGLHLVCAVMTAEFLKFSQERGNDLSNSQSRFPLSGPAARRSLVPLRDALERGAGSRRGAPSGLVGDSHLRVGVR